LVKR
jgi:hypothetical protein